MHLKYMFSLFKDDTIHAMPKVIIILYFPWRKLQLFYYIVQSRNLSFFLPKRIANKKNETILKKKKKK